MNESQETLLPKCVSDGFSGQSMANPLDEPIGAIAISGTYTGLGLFIVATQPASNGFVSAWQTSLSDTNAPWTWWTCFDALPAPTAVETMHLANSNTEAFALAKGSLYSRVTTLLTGDKTGWSDWATFGGPLFPAKITEVAVAGRPALVPSVFVVDRGRVFERHRNSTSPAYSPYVPWQELKGIESVRHTTAVSTVQLRKHLFSLARDELFASDQAAPDQAFSSWRSAGPSVDFEIVDMAAAVDDGVVYVYALTTLGELMRASYLPGGSISGWESLEQAPWLRSVTTHYFDRARAVLAGLDADGEIQWSPNGGDDWKSLF